MLPSALLPQPTVSSHLTSRGLGGGQQQAAPLGAAYWLAEQLGAAPGPLGGAVKGAGGVQGSGRGGLGLLRLLLLADRRAGVPGYVHTL